MQKISGIAIAIILLTFSAAEAKQKCRGGGLAGALNCVTKQVDGDVAPPSGSTTEKNTGITTTSVRNPDGTRTVTRKDRNGKVLSKKVVGKSVASASSTDKKTGITTTSVRNPDGTRTVTRTDKRGNILSREKVR